MRADPKLASIPVIMCTSHSDKATVVDLIGQGVRDYIVKPIAPATLLAKVKVVVADQGPVIEPREATLRRLAIGSLEYVPLAQSTVSVLDAALTDLAAALRITNARAARTAAAKAIEPAERFGAAGTIDLANKVVEAPDDLEALRLAGALLTAIGRLRNTLHNVGLIRRNGEDGAVS
jgi:CheY-like chemotaxis protein